MTGRNLILAAAAAGAACGCVDRRFTVVTNAPNAQITVDGVPIGPSPADDRWEYAGERVITASAPGYEPLTQRVRIEPRWYEYPPLDFVAEVLWPFRIEDHRRIPLCLEPARPVNQAELVNAGEILRGNATRLPPSSVPDKVVPPGTPTPPLTPGPLLTGPDTLLPPTPNTVPGGADPGSAPPPTNGPVRQ